MRFGYVRVSTFDQNLDLQIDELVAQRYLKRKSQGRASKDRHWKKYLTNYVPVTLVVWKLDRLGRSLKDLIELVSILEGKKIGFVSLNDSIDTTTPQGRLIFTLFAALAEFERDVICQRTRAGLAAARARGRKGDRPKGLSKEAQNKAHVAKTLWEQKNKTAEEIATILGISQATFFRYINSHHNA
ncbi:recombinase family protein [Cytophagaceae bacterium YF14B1]|uniref:Recombinase family protein n=1 Tax=Xanthocytophaga flava TaxID=3048013 RepID=A0AAE3QKQ3_9BACT|nr:recombinase family protein [Xanthocytophaga flavus]MDJ1478855.1 recombinase family protein [Xanthocytophaga flavus]